MKFYSQWCGTRSSPCIIQSLCLCSKEGRSDEVIFKNFGILENAARPFCQPKLVDKSALFESLHVASPEIEDYRFSLYNKGLVIK